MGLVWQTVFIQKESVVSRPRTEEHWLFLFLTRTAGVVDSLTAVLRHSLEIDKSGTTTQFVPARG
jgi:hypothetical protein